jgi:cytochrome b subunit of formate dehydrogenase
MFQTISWISLVIVLTAIAWHKATSPRAAGQKLVTKFPADDRPWWCFWDKQLSLWAKHTRLAYVFGLLSLALMAVTSFVPRLIFGKAMSGYLLMLHVGSSPVFIACLTFTVLTWAYECRLNQEDWQSICRLGRCQVKDALANPGLGCKLSFWLAAILAVPASLSMILSMYPIFGTHGLEFLFCLHQYTGLGLALLAIIHVYFALRLTGTAKT